MKEHLAPSDHRRGPQQADGSQGQCGFAAAALAGQPQHLAAPKHQVTVDDGVDRLVAIAVVHAEAADCENRLGRVAYRRRLG